MVTFSVSIRSSCALAAIGSQRSIARAIDRGAAEMNNMAWQK
jgi:hypothetical protein